MNNNQNSLVVKLKGDSTISVTTLIKTLESYKKITEQTSLIASEGNYNTEIKVSAFKEGSFEINFTIVTEIIASIFSVDSIDYTKKLTETIILMFSLYKMLKGKKASSEEIRQIIINNPTFITDNPNQIVNIYQNQAVRNGIREAVQSAKEDTSVTGITLSSDGCETVEITHDEFEELSATQDIKETQTNRISIDHNALLTIVSLSFNKGDIWKFSYHNTKIPIKLSDDNLHKAIENGMTFKKGDALKVELEITSKWDEEKKIYYDDKYKILRIIDTIHSPTQQKIF
jgi:hypothetical protein|nr:MAG TPA: hypothetical protein [Caudoviricetes sp.]DAN58651.1 MAG TPA: hypothetical protein [Caudoviricetes sp.]DAX30832.1 MAG TPA: hypothetical protein [Caudoviricetes sp.]DAX97284.1 MAG TPA: hypothetical protein [Caudoviricetes sp.]